MTLELCPFVISQKPNNKISVRPLHWLEDPYGRTCSECGSVHPDVMRWYAKQAQSEDGRLLLRQGLSGDCVVLDGVGKPGEAVFFLAHCNSFDLLNGIKAGLKSSRRYLNRLADANTCALPTQLRYAQGDRPGNKKRR